MITGSSGLIGYQLADLSAEKFTVVGFDRPGAAHPPPSADNVPVDLTSDESVIAGLRFVRERYGERIESVIHLAAYFDFSGEASPLYEQVTVQGTRRLLRGLHDLHFDIGQFIFSSTMLVHRPCEPGQAIDEDWPLDPRWPYPQSKVRTERVIEAERSAFPTVILRIAGVYDDQCHSMPLANQIERIRERHITSKIFPGHISHGQSFLHLEDLVDAIVRVVDRRRQLPSSAVFLLGEPEPLTYDELQHRFGRLIHDEEWDTTQIPKVMAKTGAWMQDVMPLIEDPFIKPWMIEFADDHYALDIGRAKTLLGWQPWHSLRETLPNMIAELKRDPLAWYREHGLSPPKDLVKVAGDT
ncbi:MAG: NAD-dependent epimerase/dehydratase family protein [Nitrospiraceae bacterium]